VNVDTGEFQAIRGEIASAKDTIAQAAEGMSELVRLNHRLVDALVRHIQPAEQPHPEPGRHRRQHRPPGCAQ
jgi:hypothetical protein